MSNAAARTVDKVFQHHLAAFAEGIDSIMSDYTNSSVLLTPDNTFKGAEIRSFFEEFLKGASSEFWGAFKIHKQETAGEIAYMTWSAAPFIVLATDTLLIANGSIAVQTFTPFSA